jgi:hypothetical protein
VIQHELLKAGASALAEGTSILNRLQQDTAIQEGSAWLKELQPYMRRMMGNYQLRVEGNSTSMRAEIDAGNLPLTERLLQPYWDCGCEDVFIIFFPPMALLDGNWKDALLLPVGGYFSVGSDTGYSIAAGFNKHRDWQFHPRSRPMHGADSPTGSRAASHGGQEPCAACPIRGRLSSPGMVNSISDSQGLLAAA